MSCQQQIVPVDPIADVEGQKEENETLSHPEKKAGKVLIPGSRDNFLLQKEAGPEQDGTDDQQQDGRVVIQRLPDLEMKESDERSRTSTARTVHMKYIFDRTHSLT